MPKYTFQQVAANSVGRILKRTV